MPKYFSLYLNLNLNILRIPYIRHDIYIIKPNYHKIQLIQSIKFISRTQELHSLKIFAILIANK